MYGSDPGRPNAVFVHIPKTAGSHTMKALGLREFLYPSRSKDWGNAGHVTFGHQDYPRLVQLGRVSKEFDESAFKFCFCRDPFDRAVSHYFWCRMRHSDVVPETMTFVEFTRELGTLYISNGALGIKGSPGRGGRTWLYSQTTPIENIDMDFIGRYENLREDLQRVASILGTKVREADRLRSSEHGPYRTYYNDEAEENVKKFYQEDFEVFGYDNRLLHVL